MISTVSSGRPSSPPGLLSTAGWTTSSLAWSGHGLPKDLLLTTGSPKSRSRRTRCEALDELQVSGSLGGGTSTISDVVSAVGSEAKCAGLRGNEPLL